MNRRRYLECVLVTTSAALAGCAEEEDVGYEETPTPVEEQTPIEGPMPDLPVAEYSDEYEASLEDGLALAGENVVTDEETFGEALEAHGIEIDRLERVDRFLFLEYYSGDPVRGVLLDMGYVVGAYAVLVDAVDDPARLQVSVLDDAGEPFGTYTVYVAWAQQFGEEELSLENYGELVFETFKTERS
ncbi:hypothetical protein OB955_03085 [Halobacteria archaeon AArc-m2/3/4]|uniref:DUF8159 domain-containing protein n=1 Tax=Natronoglomus mannanivorans TaxID=2979990 RepID=A0AAP2YWC5_9EURY|nr:hypothetical protein [Halobacteria archaeon AArc-xg1-1]MCU4971721.1 hypothetical protein [Halobacteria archaeon AArc-m2/3/4]